MAKFETRFIPRAKRPDLTIAPKAYAVEVVDPTMEARKENAVAVLASGTDAAAIHAAAKEHEQAGKTVAVWFDRYVVMHRGREYALQAKTTEAAVEEFRQKFPGNYRNLSQAAIDANHETQESMREEDANVAYLHLRTPGGKMTEITSNRAPMLLTARDQMEMAGRLDGGNLS